MMLLDTNVVSELRKIPSGRADPSVAKWAATQSPVRQFISVVSIMELRIGADLLARRDPIQGSVLDHWLDGKVISSFGERILPIDLAVARRCAALHVPDPRPDRDALIAATALVHGLTVATRNTRDFEPMGVPLLNPWEWVQ
jgi:predicted nucleic acid-binding protein